MSQKRLSAFFVLGEALESLWREKELAALLLAFLAVVNVLLLWPIIEVYLAFFQSFMEGQGSLPELESSVEGFLPYLLTIIIPMIFVSMAATVLWSRASIGGTGIAFEGGFGALARRTLWMVWRYICGLGWMMLLMAALTAIVFLLGMVTAASSDGFASGDPGLAAGAASGLMVLLIIPLYVVFLIGAMAISLLMAVSFHGEARDFRLPIHKSFICMRGNLLRATGTMFLAIFVFEMFIGMLMAMMGGLLFGEGLIAKGVALIAVFFFASIINFVYISFGARYAVKVVPELKI